MPKKKPPHSRRDLPAPAAEVSPGASSAFVMWRESIESLVVAFVLAFLFRTFEAEAFVIPTGSMSPSLQGRHKDVKCAECGFRFRTSASSEDMEDLGRRGQFRTFHDAEVVGGLCPMCRYPMPYTADLPDLALEEVEHLADVEEIATRRSYPGDRILVNKFGFDFAEPERWDVVVFKFPGDGEMNYIKRLIGLPGEELQLFQGDVFVRPLGQSKAFQIQRKPPDKVVAMLQLVHDTDYESATLHKAGWPLRWAPTTRNGWKEEADPGPQTVLQRFTVEGRPQASTAWLRYRHQVPERGDDWIMARTLAKTGSLQNLAEREGIDEAEFTRALRESIRPQLITDFNSYNARIHRQQLKAGESWSHAMDRYLGYNWVGDLAVECDLEVTEARGELILDLVEAGYHFQATIDLADGQARLGIVDGRTGQPLDFEASAPTSIKGSGSYDLRFANVDDQLLLWVDGKLVEFDESTYDPESLFAPGGRSGMLPWASAEPGGDQGDLSPAGVGARGAKLAVTRLAVLRDVYYIATNETMEVEAMIADYDSWRLDRTIDGEPIPRLNDPRDLFARPEAWPRFATRRKQQFPVKEGQFFVMGDNSPESADCRLWAGNDAPRGRPGGRYLDRRLLIGKALYVFWPHSWGSIPGAPILPGWPNFGDMRLVK